MKDKVITYVFVTYIFFMAILQVALKDQEISREERRKLKTFPEIEFTSNYITEVDSYLLDHFPFRTNFRSIKANFNYKVLRKLDNNDIYLDNGYIYKSFYPTNKGSINYFIDKTNSLIDLFSPTNKVYMLIVPDKNYYLDSDDFLQLDYDYIYRELDKVKAKNIDIRSILKMEDYYQTDTHWRQENLSKVVEVLGKNMNFKYKNQIYSRKEYDNFYGSYYGESAINRNPEKIIYLSNNIIEESRVEYLENSSLNTVYNYAKIDKMDAYEVFLDGASSFIEIYNDKAITDKELVIIRDSFGSSLTPLLIEYYSKITVIDNRYISSDIFLDLIDFTDQDVLFVYNTLLVNISGTLKG